MRQAPDVRVTGWIDAQAVEALFLSTITVAELRAGVALFVQHPSRLGIPVVRLDAQETTRDLDTLDEWLASS